MLRAVLARQRDWDVLKATGRFLNSIGAKEEAVTLRTALAGEKYSEDSHCMCEHTQMLGPNDKMSCDVVVIAVLVCNCMKL